MTLLGPGVWRAPFTTLGGKRILLCVSSDGRLLARVDVGEGEDEATIAVELERLVKLYEPP